MSVKNSFHFQPFLPLILAAMSFVIEISFVFIGHQNLRYEELAESIRGPYWLSQGRIYDGVYSNLGYYSLILLVYKLVGFSLLIPRITQAVAMSLGILLTSKLAYKYLGVRAIVPLLTLILSPTFLYFNHLATSMGIAVWYLPLWFYIFDHSHHTSLSVRRIQIFLLGLIPMLGWLTYPVFLGFLPLLIYLLWRDFSTSRRHSKLFYLFVWGFLTPLSLLYFVNNRHIAWFDPRVGSGILRGAGKLTLSLSSINQNLVGLFKDLTSQGASYLFESVWGDFSHFFPLLTVFTLILVAFKAYQQNQHRYPLQLILILTLPSLVLGLIGFDPSLQPGIRRFLGALIGFYSLYTYIWHLLPRLKITSSTRHIASLILLILPIHHLVVLPLNLSKLRQPSPNQALPWFPPTQNPQTILDAYVSQVQTTRLKLQCLANNNTPTDCRYPEIYAAISASCLFNHLNCQPIEAYSLKDQQFHPLDTTLWQQ